MAEYFTPGVYVEEYDNSPRSIEGVGTSTAGFIGFAEKGPAIGAPSLVTSFKSFSKQFGGFLSEFTHGDYRYLANSVEQFFVNGGTRCYVSRVIPDGAKAASKEQGILSVEAANEGKWGNRIQISFNTVEKKKMQLIAQSGTGYIAKSVDGFREGDLVDANGEYNRIATIYDNTVTFEQPFTGEVVDTGIIPKTVLYLVSVDVSVRYNDEVENYGDLRFNVKATNYVGSRLALSELVKVSIGQPEKIGNPIEAIFGEGNTSGMLNLEGGSDGSIDAVTAATFIGVDGGPGKRTGIQSFVENSTVSMLAIPGVTDPEVIVSLVAHCENLKSRVAVFDMPKDAYKTKDLIEYRGIIDSTYAAMYHPWIQVFDRSSNRSDFIPPSGAVMGVYSRTDINRGVHKAPATEIVFCTGLKVNYTEAEQDIRNPEGSNLIRAIPGQG
ncbi:MAG: phage tail sheath subtilisin-like domain-containing protein, partial [Lachnospiraceae bacterium]|nr:phage tail sheath subtilisin-like domain-containing protein [Lachnospiraceae bacterium]